MIKLIQKNEIFKIQLSRGNVEGSEFVDLFVKRSLIINARVPLKNYKKYAKGNWSESQYRTDMFEVDENAGTKRNDKTIIDSDYDINNM